MQLLSGFVGTSGGFAGLVLPLSKCLVTGIPRLIGSSREKEYPSLTVRDYNGLSWDTCRGIVTADALVKGLSRGAIATRKPEGVNRDKGHEVYTGSAPYGEGKSLRSSFEWDCLCLDNQGANR